MFTNKEKKEMQERAIISLIRELDGINTLYFINRGPHSAEVLYTKNNIISNISGIVARAIGCRRLKNGGILYNSGSSPACDIMEYINYKLGRKFVSYTL